MASYGRIGYIYKNQDMLIEASRKEGKNLAVDVSSRIKVLRLLEARIKYDERERYFPGESYLVSFKELERSVKSRKRVNLDGVNIFPFIVDEIVSGREWEDVYSNLQNTGIRRVRSEDLLGLRETMNRKNLEELANFAQICKPRREIKGLRRDRLVVLQDINPITAWTKGYELDGVYYNRYESRKIGLPATISAEEAEFTFLSSNNAKISDGENNIGNYKEGVLTLAKPTLVVYGLEGRMKEGEDREVLSDKNNPFTPVLKKYRREIIGASAVLASIILTRGEVLRYMTLPFRLLRVPLQLLRTPEGILGAGIAIGVGYNYSRRKKMERLDLSTETYMRTAFYGEVKDRRFEVLEKLIDNWGKEH